MSMYDDTVDVTPEGVSEGAALSGMFGESTPVETERGIETITEEIIFYKNVGGQAVIEIGRRLTEAKAQLKHGGMAALAARKSGVFGDLRTELHAHCEGVRKYPSGWGFGSLESLGITGFAGI